MVTVAMVAVDDEKDRSFGTRTGRWERQRVDGSDTCRSRRLTAALAEYRHLRSKRVFCQDDRTPFTRQIVQGRMLLAARRANVRRGVHILRHTFCSHLSMRLVPPEAIQELAGHADLTMTQR